MSEDKKETKYLKPISYLATYLSLGFLIGNLIGLSSNNLAESVLTVLLTIIGSVSILKLTEVKLELRKVYLSSIFALSIGILVGVYLSIFISENQLLSSKKVKSREEIIDRKYLRSSVINKVNQIDQSYQNKEIELEEAYNKIYNIVTDGE